MLSFDIEYQHETLYPHHDCRFSGGAAATLDPPNSTQTTPPHPNPTQPNPTQQATPTFSSSLTIAAPLMTMYSRHAARSASRPLTRAAREKRRARSAVRWGLFWRGVRQPPGRGGGERVVDGCRSEV